MRTEVELTRPPRRSVLEAPWTVIAYAVTAIVALAVWTLLDGDPQRALGSTILNVLLVVGLLKAFRAAWIIALVFAGLGLIGAFGFLIEIASGTGLRAPDVSSMFFWVISSTLLIHPLTRAWATR
jgi:hypothetical protein